MKVLVCGSRDWDDPTIITRALVQWLPRGSTVITGGARGADRMAETIARRLGFEVEVFRPDWRPEGVYDPQAGFKRNIVMLEQEPDFVLAFWKAGSTGTGHTIGEALKRGIRVEVYDEDGLPPKVQYLLQLDS